MTARTKNANSATYQKNWPQLKNPTLVAVDAKAAVSLNQRNKNKYTKKKFKRAKAIKSDASFPVFGCQFLQIKLKS